MTSALESCFFFEGVGVDFDKMINKILFIVLLFIISCSQSRTEDKGELLTNVQVKLLGAAREVSGSSYYINTNIDDVLIDCGIFYPGNKSIDFNVDKQNTKKKNFYHVLNRGLAYI